MIIQCEKCQTRFRLDDSKLKDVGVKVRCAKCKHVFTVYKESSEDESVAAPDFQSGISFESTLSSVADNTETTAPANDSINFGDVAFGAVQKQIDDSEAEHDNFDASAISFETDEQDDFGIADAAPAVTAEPAATAGEVDFSEFDFGDAAEDNIKTEAAVAEPSARKEALQSLDFSDDDMFGSVVQSNPEPSDEAISFDFGEDSFAESMEMGSAKDASKGGGSPFNLESSGDAPFNLGEIDFGDELTSVAVHHVNPDDLKPSQEVLFAPMAQGQQAPVKSENDFQMFQQSDAVTPTAADELPPLSIASRRKQNPLFSGIIAVVAVIVVTVLGYFGYSTFSNSGKEAVDNGAINIRAVKASYVKNKSVGELLVISGEALNNYAKARAAIQVKVTVLDATDQPVASKTAYSGNPLTKEQLETLTLEKLETAMSNQFGDSLANMEVAPDKAIPFVVVVANLPKGAKNFTVTSAGSTVATGGKQPPQ